MGSSMTPMFIHADQGQDQLETVLVLVDPEGTLPVSFRWLFIGMYLATFIFMGHQLISSHQIPDFPLLPFEDEMGLTVNVPDQVPEGNTTFFKEY